MFVTLSPSLKKTECLIRDSFNNQTSFNLLLYYIRYSYLKNNTVDFCDFQIGIEIRYFFAPISSGFPSSFSYGNILASRICSSFLLFGLLFGWFIIKVFRFIFNLLRYSHFHAFMKADLKDTKCKNFLIS